MLDSEALLFMRSLMWFSIAFLLVAKIWWECRLEALRLQLRALDAELFDLARCGSAATGDLAYQVVRDGIRRAIRGTYRVSLFRHLTALLSRQPSLLAMAIERDSQHWEDALIELRIESTRMDLAALRQRVVLTVNRAMTPGAALLAAVNSLAASLMLGLGRRRRLAIQNTHSVGARV